MYKYCAMVEVDITNVKSDVTGVGTVLSGIKCAIEDRYVETTRSVYSEMMQ